MTATTPFTSSHVLLAGGDEALWKSLIELSHLHGASLHSASSAGEALDRLQEEPPPALAAVDLDSPGMCDPALVEALKTRGPGIALLLASRSFDHAFLVDLLVSGSTFFLKKPFAAEDLDLAVRQLLQTGAEEAPSTRRPQPFGSTGVILEYRTDEIVPALVGSHLTSILTATDSCDTKSAGLIEIAVHESLVNAVEHGNLGLSSKLKAASADEPDEFSAVREARLNDEHYASRKIRVRFQLDSAKMEVEISDQGRGFDHGRIMANLSRRIEPESLTDCHGRGLLMVACCMDDVSFNETGNRITFTRYTKKSNKLADTCRIGSE